MGVGHQESGSCRSQMLALLLSVSHNPNHARAVFACFGLVKCIDRHNPETSPVGPARGKPILGSSEQRSGEPQVRLEAEGMAIRSE